MVNLLGHPVNVLFSKKGFVSRRKTQRQVMKHSLQSKAFMLHINLVCKDASLGMKSKRVHSCKTIVSLPFQHANSLHFGFFKALTLLKKKLHGCQHSTIGSSLIPQQQQKNVLSIHKASHEEGPTHFPALNYPLVLLGRVPKRQATRLSGA